jgi:lysophospholipase L1-like esterase
MRVAGFVTSINMLWIVATGSVVLGGFVFVTLIKAQSRVWLKEKVVAYYQALAILILNALVVAAGLELAAKSGSKIMNLISRPNQQLVGEGNPREKVSYYLSRDWAERYWYEHRLSGKERYYPYVGWRRAPFKGEFINVDRNGIRLTPGADCRPGAFKVFTFGESSMWGTGSPDWATIPAYLQRSFENLKQGPVCVTNFAESAYVSTQDLIMLLLQLQGGNIPDLVIFYDIAGDIPAGYQSGRPGVPGNLDQIATRFEGRSEPPGLLDVLRSTSSYQLISQFMDKLTPTVPEQKEQTSSNVATDKSATIEVSNLSDQIVQDYFESYKVVNALSQNYGFKYFFFLPPAITLGRKPLTIEEQKMKRQVENEPKLSRLFAAVYQKIEKKSFEYPYLYSMVNVFDDCPTLVWIDAGHVTPLGNQLIANRMVAIIQARSSDQD